MRFIIGIFLLLVSCGSGKEEKTEETRTSPQIEAESPKMDVKQYKLKVVNIFHHDSVAFTQGLQYVNGWLYESTGLYGHSSLRKVDLKTGKIMRRLDLSPNYFGEGCAVYNNKIYQITWMNSVCFVYDLATFNKINEFHYPGEGWGITLVDGKFAMSDGTSNLRFYSPDNFQLINNLAVTNSGKPVHNINELEYIEGEIWANIWQCDSIIKINPKTGAINGWIDIKPLRNYLDLNDFPDVLNGIAYDSVTKRIFLTGKFWSQMFEVKVEEK